MNCCCTCVLLLSGCTDRVDWYFLFFLLGRAGKLLKVCSKRNFEPFEDAEWWTVAEKKCENTLAVDARPRRDQQNEPHPTTYYFIIK